METQNITRSTQRLNVSSVGEEAAGFINPEEDLPQAVSALIDKGFLADAVKLLSDNLPTRVGVQWACQCFRLPDVVLSCPAEESVLRAVEDWLADPTDVRRRTAYEIAERTGLNTAAGCAAMAAFTGEGSVAPIGIHEVQAPAGVSNQILAAGIILAAVGHQPEKADEKYRMFLDKGLQLHKRLTGGARG